MPRRDPTKSSEEGTPSFEVQKEIMTGKSNNSFTFRAILALPASGPETLFLQG
jgi:hypothetical protein